MDRTGQTCTELADCGVKRINVSIDTLDPEKFRKVTRWGELARVLEGVDAAQKAGLHIKINAVALKGFNDQKFHRSCDGTRSRMDLTLIETMPMGEIDEDRTDQYLPLSLVRASLESEFTLAESSHRTGGPARYVTVKETAVVSVSLRRSPIISAKAATVYALTCTGTLYMCLGQNDAADLRAPLRASEGNELLSNAIDEAIGRKPKGHDFIIDRRAAKPAVSVT